ncbi:MAG TPA: hypothetical protein VET65_00465 [Candidatus Limnocylindrales bacterium]|nr:hypothetical protein [Candidatus Limnocylindrales bacterium]
MEEKGPIRTEKPTIRRLRAFIAEQGYDVVGEHEEGYRSRPDVRVLETLIRYRIRRHGR